MQSDDCFTVDEAVALLFPEDPAVVVRQKADSLAKFSSPGDDMDSYLAMLPSCLSADPLSANSLSETLNDVWDIQCTLNVQVVQNVYSNTVSFQLAAENTSPPHHSVSHTSIPSLTANLAASSKNSSSEIPALFHASSHVSDSDGESASRSEKTPQKEKKRLIAWTPEEHQRFLFALEKLRTEDTEAVNKHGKKTKGLGPGIAEVIALAVGTRNAAQVRSHAQKHFTRQRRETGWN